MCINPNCDMAPKKKTGKEDSKPGDADGLLKVEAEVLSLRRLLELKTYEVGILKVKQRVLQQIRGAGAYCCCESSVEYAITSGCCTLTGCQTP